MSTGCGMSKTLEQIKFYHGRSANPERSRVSRCDLDEAKNISFSIQPRFAA
jgi:hypothetical protein